MDVGFFLGGGVRAEVGRALFEGKKTVMCSRRAGSHRIAILFAAS